MSEQDYTQRFDAAVAAWRQKHKLREDDAILLCVDLFRIHQEHWDQIRRAEMPSLPSLDHFQAHLAKFVEINTSFQRQANTLLEELHRRESNPRESGVSLSGALIIFLSALVAGFCMGKAFL